MRDEISIGSTPASEDCAQVGSEGYYPQARRECRAFIGQLQRQFGPPPEGARLAVKSNAHDFGTYLDVVVRFDDDNPEAVEYAYRCEEHASDVWDAEAKAELAESGRGLTTAQA